MAVQLQWGLEQTSNSTIEIATGLMRAATTDNVQPLALLACERFGNTLAISPDTISKIERTVLPTPQPAVISFLKSTVGYSANDCATHLGKNTAGLQFLALATALITTVGTFEGAIMVQEMLASTAKDKTLLPTVRQVRDLLNSLEPRCYRAGIADDVVGWEIMFKRPDFVFRGLAHRPSDYFPQKEGVYALVDALRQLRRVGDAGINKVTITTANCAAWTMAFVKWSLGYPPTVVQSDGSTILEQAGSDVTIILPMGQDGFCVTVHSSIREPSDLVDSRYSLPVTGMVSLRTYGDLLRRDCGFKAGLASVAFREAIPFALLLVVGNLKVHQSSNSRNQLSGYHVRLEISPFPRDEAFKRICSLLFEEELQWCPSHEECLRLADLPSMARYLADVKSSCQCNACGSGEHMRCKLESDSILRYCKKAVADIISLSLFETPDLLRVSLRPRSLGGGEDTVYNAVSNILDGLESRVCDLASIVERALWLIGHDVSQDEEHPPPVISSHKGQTVWPAIFESLEYMHVGRGFLSLSWLPGSLRHNGDVYKRANGPSRRWVQKPSKDPPCSEDLLTPRNFFPNSHMKWSVSIATTGLVVCLGIEDPKNRYPLVEQCPWRSLLAMTSAFPLADCAHDPHAALKAPDLDSIWIGPLKLITDPMCSRASTPESSDQEEPLPRKEINVVAVDGNNGLRFLALGNTAYEKGTCLLRRKACLACCLDVGRRIGAATIIL